MLSSYAIQPIHQPAYTVRKNSTDSALIIDAIDLLYADHVGVFCLVTSDSDYTRSAMRLRESARRVFGIGSRAAADAFQKACDRFTWLELIEEAVPTSPLRHDGSAEADNASAGEGQVIDQDSGAPLASLESSLLPLQDVLLPALRAKADDRGWAPLATVGHYVVGVNSSFDSRAYGYANLGQLVRAQPFLEVEERVHPHWSRQLRARDGRS